MSESIFEWDVGGICRYWEEGMEIKWLGSLLEPLTNVISCLCVAMTWRIEYCVAGRISVLQQTGIMPYLMYEQFAVLLAFFGVVLRYSKGNMITWMIK